MCVQEEGRLVMEVGENAMLATQGKAQTQANKKGKGKIPPQVDIKKESTCSFIKERIYEERIC
jgi:hypothetical protein